MRILNLDESIDKVQSKATEVEFCDKKFYLSNLKLFCNFLQSQPRLNNSILRIENNFSDISRQLTDLEDNSKVHKVEKLFFKLESNDQRGAFGFFIIKNLLEKDKWTAPYDLIGSIFNTPSNYEESKERFNEVIFKPFINLIIEILEESRSFDLNDFFSKKEVEETEIRIDKILEKLTDLSLGQEVLFEEIQELKEQLTVLNKKNWVQLLKGKLIDASVTGIAKEIIKFIYKEITGTEFPLLLG